MQRHFFSFCDLNCRKFSEIHISTINLIIVQRPVGESFKELLPTYAPMKSSGLYFLSHSKQLVEREQN